MTFTMIGAGVSSSYFSSLVTSLYSPPNLHGSTGRNFFVPFPPTKKWTVLECIPSLFLPVSTTFQSNTGGIIETSLTDSLLPPVVAFQSNADGSSPRICCVHPSAVTRRGYISLSPHHHASALYSYYFYNYKKSGYQMVTGNPKIMTSFGNHFFNYLTYHCNAIYLT